MGGFAKATGSLALNGNLRPPNDDFADAVALSGVTQAVHGTTFDATTETGEPFVAQNQSSVWYTWQTPFDGPAFVVNTSPTCTSAYETLIGTGSDAGSFTPFAGADALRNGRRRRLHPAVATVQRGWTVFWQNTGSDAHTVTDGTASGWVTRAITVS